MKCPNCGTEIPADFLYCEQCGEEIHIVPDFEPEVEFNLEQTLHDIADEFHREQTLHDMANEFHQEPEKQEEPKLENVEEDVCDERNQKKRRIRKSVVWGVSLGLLLLAAVTVSVLYYRYDSVDVQLEKAKQYAAGGQYERAVEYYKHALELDGDNVDIELALSDVYFQINDKEEYEYWLRRVVADPSASLNQLESAYGKLIAIYRSQEDYKTIYELLKTSDNEDILAKYRSYLPTTPEFSLEEGYYSMVQPLKLTAAGGGKIYYTLDGSTPNENSNLYTMPILLEDGDYYVSACLVNEYGIAGDVITKNYHITVETLPPPEVGTGSGDYAFPTNIEILEDTDHVYYTTDGSVPTGASKLYTGSIPMPLGKSTYKFIRIEDDKSSEVIECTYNLVLNTEYTVQDMEWVVIQYAVNSGKVRDFEGHFTDTEEMYKYEYQYVTNISGAGDFFVIAEFYSDTGGVKNRTGNYFAVNAYTAELFKLQIEGNHYTLIDIETESQ